MMSCSPCPYSWCLQRVLALLPDERLEGGKPEPSGRAAQRGTWPERADQTARGRASCALTRSQLPTVKDGRATPAGKAGKASAKHLDNAAKI